MADLLRRVSAWWWVVGIVVVSTLVRAWAARSMPGPFIQTDELTYAELGRSFADSGSFTIRGAPANGYGLVYPVLISPAFAVFDSLPNAYAAVKAINAFVMSLAAVPAYLLARRVVGQLGSLTAALLTVALPAFAYTATVMTENVFLPVSLFACLALLHAVERPTWRNSALLLLVLGVALATRIQAVYLAAAAFTAPLLLLALAGNPRRLLGFGRFYAVLLGGGALLAAAQVARGGSVRSLLGAYAAVRDVEYDVAEALRFWLWHVEELTLVVGVLPVAALLALVFVSRRLPLPVQRYLAVSLAMLFWVTLVVAVFASRHSGRISERNMFVAAPLLFVALLVWVQRREAHERRAVLPAAIVAGALVVFFPYARFIDAPARGDTPSLLPIWSAYGSLPFGPVWQTVLLVAGAACALFVLVPRRFVAVVPVVVLAFLCAFSVSVWRGKEGFRQSGIGALFTGIRSVPRDWIDESLPPGATASAIFTGVADRFTINVNEFFNRKLEQIYYVGGPTPGGLAETELRLGRSGIVRRADTGAPLTDRYVLVDSSVEIVGEPVARDVGAWGMTLWRVAGPTVRRTEVTVTGLYEGDTWSGPEVRYVRRGCDGGRLGVTLSGDEALYGDDAATVIARVGGRVVARARVTAPGTRRLEVPFAAAAGTCRVTFSVSPTRIPAQVLGTNDDRELGAHFEAFVFEPDR